MTVELQPQALEASGVSVSEVVQALQAQNLAAPVGRLNGELEERTIRLQGRAEGPADFAKLVVAERQAADDTPGPGGQGVRRHRGAPHAGALQRAPGGGHRGHQVEGLQHHRGERRDPRLGWPAAAHHAAGREAGDRAGRGRAGQPGGGQRAGGADRRRAADRAGGVPLPQLVALDGHHRPGAAGVACWPASSPSGPSASRSTPCRCSACRSPSAF